MNYVMETADFDDVKLWIKTITSVDAKFQNKIVDCKLVTRKCMQFFCLFVCLYRLLYIPVEVLAVQWYLWYKYINNMILI